MTDGTASPAAGAGTAAPASGGAGPSETPQQSQTGDVAGQPRVAGTIFEGVAAGPHAPQAKPGGADQQGASGAQGGEGAVSGQATATPLLTFQERPAWLNEAFWDRQTGAVDVQRLAQQHDHFRGIVAAKAHQAPDKPDGYQIEIADDNAAAAYARDVLIAGDDDPVVAAVQKAAHAAGVSKQAFSAIATAYLEAQAELLPEPLDPASEMRKLGPKGQALIKAQYDFVLEQMRNGNLTQEQGERFFSWMTSAEDVLVMRKVLEASGALPSIDVQAVNMAAATPDAAALHAEIGELMKLPDSPQREQKYQALMQKFERLYGHDPQRTSALAGAA